VSTAVVEGDPREAILDAAAGLFTTKGFSATGTREIAAGAGLRQASLFHWFSRKDDILLELLVRTVAPALERSDRLRSTDERPEVRLYLLARGDVANLCGGPWNLASLQLLPEARAPQFDDFWARREELRRRYRELVGQLGRAGRLVIQPVDLATDIAFGAVESVITWFDRSGRLSVDRVAHEVAVGAVRAIAARPPQPSVLARAHARI
jgi:AcrR family transcriptional regulator